MPRNEVLRRASQETLRLWNPVRSAPAVRCGSRPRALSPAVLFPPRLFPRALPSGRASHRIFWLPPATSPQCPDDRSASCALPQLPHDLFHQRIRIALVFGNLRCNAVGLTVAKIVADRSGEERVAQHLCDALSPVFDPTFASQIALAEMQAITLDSLQHFGYTGSVTGNRLHDRRSPVVLAHGERLHRPDLALHSLRAVAVRLVDHEDVGDLHDSGLDRLHLVAHAGDQHHYRDVSERDDVDLI